MVHPIGERGGRKKLKMVIKGAVRKGVVLHKDAAINKKNIHIHPCMVNQRVD